jgi:hypothetical protein
MNGLLTDHSALVKQLIELVAALDRRMPQVMRAGEAAIARDAAALRRRTVLRLEELCPDIEKSAESIDFDPL